MNFDHVWVNSAENLTPNFLNNRSYVPSPYSDPTHNVRSGPNSLVNLPFCNSPECSRLGNFSSEAYAPSPINQNVRYHPYPPPYIPFKETDLGKHETLNFYANEDSYGSEVKDKDFFFSQMNCQQNTMMYPPMSRERYDVKTNHLKSNMKRKRQRYSRNKKSLAKGNVPTEAIDNNPHTISDTNVVFNCIRNKEDLVRNKMENFSKSVHMASEQNYAVGINYTNKADDNVLFNCVNNKEDLVRNKEEKFFNNVPMANEQNYTTVPNYSNKAIMVANGNNTGNSINNSNMTDKINFLPRIVNDTVFVPEYQNDPFLCNLTNEHENITTDLSFENPITSTDSNSFQSLNNIDLSDCHVTHITMPENTTFNVQNIQQENSENVNLENFFFEPIFEGKDENGEDIVVLFGNSNAQQTNNGETIPNAFIDNQNAEVQNNQEVLKYSENNIAISNETSLESQVQQEAVNELGETIFLSHVDDYASEEIVTTSKKKHKKTNNKNVKITDQSCAVSMNQSAGSNYTMNSLITKPSTSTENENTSTDAAQNGNSSRKKHKRINARSRQRMPAWKRRLLWKSNEPLKNIQRIYFKKFMKRVKLENAHLKANEEFWKMYRIIVTQIGGNMLQTMYNILPQLIRNSEEAKRRSNNVASKMNKTRLQIKFPARKKKQNDSKN